MMINSSTVSGMNFTEDVKKIYLNKGDSLRVEASAMLACKDVEVQTGINGSIMSIAKRYFLGGEGLFQNTFTAKNDGAWVALEEEVPGQIHYHELHDGEKITLGRTAYVAADKNVEISTSYAGITGWLKGIGYAKLNAKLSSGNSGRIFFNSTHGVVKAINVSEKEGPVIIDNDNIVAYTGNLTSMIRKLGGIRSFLFSGEGSVNEFKGNGIVFVGSGATAASQNMAETIVKTALGSIFQDPITTINRITLLGMVYFVVNSSALVDSVNSLGKAITLAGQSFANAQCCKGSIA